jgi:chemotaxis protein CheD
VGDRNLLAVEDALTALGIPIRGRETGGTWGRSIEFNTVDGTVLVRTAQHGARQL